MTVFEPLAAAGAVGDPPAAGQASTAWDPRPAAAGDRRATPDIAVVGVGAGEPRGPARERLAAAVLVVGGRRHLDAHAPAGTPQARLGADLRPALEAVAAAGGPVVVLASGDPGFFGVVRVLAERFDPERLEVLPAPSSVSLAFARIGLPWDDALVVSAHGRAPASAINAARAYPKVAVLTAPDFPPAELARALAGFRRHLVVVERLGEAEERMTTGSPEEIAGRAFAEPNVVLVLDPGREVGAKRCAWPPRAPAGWALAEEAFDHRDGMITKAEVRALVLARLGPGIGDLVWDVGTGSGAVAIECARFGAAVIAVDREAGQCERAAANATRHGVTAQVVHGRAPEALAGLPEPDCVFVGGAGGELDAVLEVAAARARRRVVITLATLERVAPAAQALTTAGLEVDTAMVQASRLQGVAGLNRLAAANPVFVVTGARQ